MEYDVLIIGGGPAGCTAGLYAARAGLRALVLTGSEPGGQLGVTETVENCPGIGAVNGPDLAAAMLENARQAGAEVRMEQAASLDLSARTVRTSAGEYRGKALIYAAGAAPRTLDVPGEAALRGRGVSFCAACDGPLFRGKDVAVIGGGTAGTVSAPPPPGRPAGGAPVSCPAGGGGKYHPGLERRDGGHPGPRAGHGACLPGPPHRREAGTGLRRRVRRRRPEAQYRTAAGPADPGPGRVYSGGGGHPDGSPRRVRRRGCAGQAPAADRHCGGGRRCGRPHGGGLAGEIKSVSGALRRRRFFVSYYTWGSRYFSRSLSRLAVKAPSPLMPWM